MPLVTVHVLVRVAIDEGTILRRVRMEINTKVHLIAVGIVELTQHALDGQHRWTGEFGRHVPAAIHILTDEIATIVAQKDAVRIEHRNDFEDEMLSQYCRHRMSTEQKFEKALADVRGGRFASMRPDENDDDALSRRWCGRCNRWSRSRFGRVVLVVFVWVIACVLVGSLHVINGQ